MAYNLIPFPIAIIFAIIFVLACVVVLWKLRRRDKVYSFLFKASLIIGILLLAVFLYSIITGMLS
jgi:uncharacterized membrane protein